MEVNEAKDLLNLKWRKLTNKELEAIPYDVVEGMVISRYYYTEDHIDFFVRWVMKNVSREFGLPVDEVAEVIIQENSFFYERKKKIFLKNCSYISNSTEIEQLLSFFTVPEMTKVDKVLREYKRHFHVNRRKSLNQKFKEERKGRTFLKCFSLFYIKIKN